MITRAGRWTALVLVTVAAGAASEEPLAPFVARWENPTGGAADVSFLLDAPAGGRGFVGVRDGHLATPDGRRVRLWGVNLTGAAGLPSKADAPRLAAILARHGLNAVRFHFLDLPAPRGLVDATRDDTRALDAAMLDRLDFFVAELKKRGIWTNLNLNVGRRYRAGDGVRDFEKLGFAKGLTHFDERLVALQKEYARQLLTHRNPYTGAEYRHEPAVAIVEMVNENSLVESWFSDRLLGKATQKDPGTWTDVTESYARDLTARYHAWLRERLSPGELARVREEAGAGPGADVPRLTRDGFAGASALRFRTEAAFYVSLEERFFRGMASFLRDEIGVRALLVGTADHNHGRSGYPLLRSTAALDVVDGHVYWQHPDYLEGRAASGQSFFRIPNTPMVDDPLHSTVVQLARSAAAGKPYTVSEVNHPFPNEFAAEGIPILAAYAALQDWDGVFLYTFEHAAPPDWEERVRGHFDLRPDPVKMAGVATGALLFLRPDVRAASTAHLRSYTEEAVLESLRLPGSAFPFFTPGFDLSLPLRQRTRIGSLAGGPTDTSSPAPPGTIVSETGELAWRGRDGETGGLVTVETDRTEAFVGFVRARPASLRHLRAEVLSPFAAITLSTLDGESIARSTRLLLTAGARTSNTGMKWNAGRTGLDDWGVAPARVETVRGRVTLQGLTGAKGVVVTALSADGWKTEAAAPAIGSGDGWRFDLGAVPTVWYVVDVER